VDDPRRFGIAEIANGKITRLVEKPEQPTSNLAIIGLYSFADARMLKQILASHVNEDKRTRGEIQLTDALQRMLEDGEQITPFEVSNWFDCGKKETMLETNRVLLDGVANATSGNGARIMPPVWVGKGVEMQDAKIGPYVTIDDYAKITGSTISNSVIGRRSVVEGAVVRDSLVGDETRIVGNADGKELVLNIGDYSEVADAVSV
jgi:glucose-1-phosphate thymidylyltransferase